MAPSCSTTPPRSETAALEAARVADLVVVPCRPQMVDLETVPVTTQLIVLARDAAAGQPSSERTRALARRTPSSSGTSDTGRPERKNPVTVRASRIWDDLNQTSNAG